MIHPQREGKWAVQCVLIADATTSHSFIFLFFYFLFRAVGDFRAEFCDKPTARTPPPSGLILRLLIHRAVYCNLFLNAAKEANGTKQWAFKVWAREAKRRFFLWRFRAIRFLPDKIPSRTGITYKVHSREDPKKKKTAVACRGRFPS